MERFTIHEGNIIRAGVFECEKFVKRMITIWKDGTYRVQGEMDDYYCQQDADWFLSISINQILSELEKEQEGRWKKK